MDLKHNMDLLVSLKTKHGELIIAPMMNRYGKAQAPHLLKINTWLEDYY